MKFHQLPFFMLPIIWLLLSTTAATTTTIRFLTRDLKVIGETHRRILHQPLYSESPPPDSEPLPPPSLSTPDSPAFPNPDQPFFPEVPTGPNSDQTPPPPTLTNGSIPYPAATQPNKPAKRVAMAISVGIVTLGMLSALAFFLYRYRARHSGDTQKLVGGNSQRVLEEIIMPPQSNFLYIGTVEPPLNRRSVLDANCENEANGSPYHKLNLIKRLDRYRPSPELQPLPPLCREFTTTSSSAAISSSDKNNHEAFYTPNGLSLAANEDLNQNVVTTTSSNSSVTSCVPHSKRTSSKSRISASSQDMKCTIISSIKQPTPPPPSPPPRSQPDSPQVEHNGRSVGYIPQRPKLSLPPPPPPNRVLLQSISKQSSNKIVPPPPPPPPLPLLTPQKMIHLETNNSYTPTSQPLQKRHSRSSGPKESLWTKRQKDVKQEGNTNGATSLERHDSDEMEGGKPKLKALHWDKVRATSDRATVWDQLNSGNFQLNGDMMENLFGCNSTSSVSKPARKKMVIPPVENEKRVLDPKKSQNIAILLRALNVTRDEVSEALLNGNPENIGVELLETLEKMAPTKEEEIKLQRYSGDISKLGSAERFLKYILDIPFAFKRVEAMLYRANFDSEVNYLRKSYQTLEVASEELKNSRLFLKLLEAVLRAGNRMNVGTNRGDARAFKLDTLLKLVDVKATDGKTTLLHFVVQEITRSEGAVSEATNENIQKKIKTDDFKKQNLQVVAGLSRDLGNVKKAAGMDSDVLSSYVSKLETGLEKIRLTLEYEKPNMQGKFFDSMKTFIREADKEITRIKCDERKALCLVKEATEYFHGDSAKEEAHPLRIFMIVRDFLSVLDHVCKEVGRIQDRVLVGSARSFQISSNASQPVLNRYKIRQHEESPSP